MGNQFDFLNCLRDRQNGEIESGQRPFRFRERSINRLQTDVHSHSEKNDFFFDCYDCILLKVNQGLGLLPKSGAFGDPLRNLPLPSRLALIPPRRLQRDVAFLRLQVRKGYLQINFLYSPKSKMVN